MRLRQKSGPRSTEGRPKMKKRMEKVAFALDTDGSARKLGFCDGLPCLASLNGMLSSSEERTLKILDFSLISSAKVC
jgi:hypothetical protein